MKKLLQSSVIAGLLAGAAGCGAVEGIMNTQSGNGTGPADMEIAEDVEYGETEYELIAGANNTLGMKLMENLAKEQAGNIFISPTSLYMALAMVYNGADGVTKDEIAKVLQVEGVTREEMNRANASLVMQLASESKQIELNIANSIWVKDSYQFREEFIESSQDYYNAKIEAIDVSDPESADLINNWVDEATNGKIEKMAAKPLPGNLVVMLLNAIYFKGDWQVPFNKELTAERSFFLPDGSAVKVPLMKQQGQLSYMETDTFQAVSLPYGEGEMRMHVFLPAESSSLDDFRDSMNAESWTAWMDDFEMSEGTLLLPKFKLEYEVSLNDPLKQLGMETAFTNADLSNMFKVGGGLFISEVKQKTYVDVNEEGTEAAAVTSVTVAESAPANPPFEMEVNRPFLFAITDEETGVILFMGAIEDPA